MPAFGRHSLKNSVLHHLLFSAAVPNYNALRFEEPDAGHTFSLCLTSTPSARTLCSGTTFFYGPTFLIVSERAETNSLRAGGDGIVLTIVCVGDIWLVSFLASSSFFLISCSVAQVVGAVGFNSQQLQLPAGLDPEVNSIIQRCLAQNQDDRPSFSEVLVMLRGLTTLPMIQQETEDE